MLRVRAGVDGAWTRLTPSGPCSAVDQVEQCVSPKRPPGSWSDPAALGDADLTVGPFWLDGPHRGVFVRTLNGFSVVSRLPRALNPLVA